MSKTHKILANVIAYDIHRTGGSSINQHGERPPKCGFMVSLSEWEAKYRPGQDTLKAVYNYLTTTPAPTTGSYYGAWTHENSIYMDISEHFDDARDALNAARDRKQLAIYWLDGIKDGTPGFSITPDELEEVLSHI